MSLTEKMISIITPSYNRSGFIHVAIESVFGQNYPSLEHIVVDGGSTDGTLELMDHYPEIRVITGPDQGMYDAINKGLAAASGDIIGFLNTDDSYAPNAFANVISAFDGEATMAVAGRAIIYELDDNGNQEIVLESQPDRNGLIDAVTVGSPFFNAWFFRRSVFDKLGVFDARYRIVADRDFMLRFALSEMPYAIIDKSIYRYQRHPGALTFDITDAKLGRVVDEHLIMTGVYLHRIDLPDASREKIRELRTRDTLDMSIRCLKNRDFAGGLDYAWAGIRYDRNWPLRFWQRLNRRMRLTSA